MVNLTSPTLVQLTQSLMRMHPKNVYNDGYWRRRQVLRLTSHFYGKSRNCFSVAIRRLQKCLQHVVRGRELRKISHVEAWEDRISAGMQEHGYIPSGAQVTMEALQRANILLNRQSLANLATWEPRTFEALCKIAAVKAKQEGITPEELGPPPPGIYTRGKL